MVIILEREEFLKLLQWNVENIVMMVIKHLKMNQISALNKP